jgi:hypothetical protein
MNKIQEPKIRFISKKNHFEIFKWICPYIFVFSKSLIHFVYLYKKLMKNEEEEKKTRIYLRN